MRNTEDTSFWESDSNLRLLGKEIREELSESLDYETKTRLQAALQLISQGKNDPRAHYFLAVHYQNGWGITKNAALARKHYETAAELGHAGACYELVLRYLNGNTEMSITKNYDKAKYYADKANSRSEDEKNYDDESYKQKNYVVLLKNFSPAFTFLQKNTNAKTVPVNSMAKEPAKKTFFSRIPFINPTEFFRKTQTIQTKETTMEREDNVYNTINKQQGEEQKKELRITEAQSALVNFKSELHKNLYEIYTGFQKVVAEDPSFIETLVNIGKQYFVTSAAANAVGAIADAASNETVGNAFRMSTKLVFVVAFLIKGHSDNAKIKQAKKFIEIVEDMGGIDKLSEFAATYLIKRLHFLLISCSDIDKLAFFFTASITNIVLHSGLSKKGLAQKWAAAFFNTDTSDQYTKSVKNFIAKHIIPEANSDLYEEKFLFIFNKNIRVMYGKQEIDLNILLNNSPAIIIDDGSFCKNETDKLKAKQYCWLPAQRLSRTQASELNYHDNSIPKLEISNALAINLSSDAQPSNIDESILPLLEEYYYETIAFLKETNTNNLSIDDFTSLSQSLFNHRSNLAEVIDDYIVFSAKSFPQEERQYQTIQMSNKLAAIINYSLKYVEYLYAYNFKLTTLQIWDKDDRLFLEKELLSVKTLVTVIKEKHSAEKSLDEINLNWINDYIAKLKTLMEYNDKELTEEKIKIRFNKKIIDHYGMYLRHLEKLNPQITATDELYLLDTCLDEMKKGTSQLDSNKLDKQTLPLIAKVTKPLINKYDQQWVVKGNSYPSTLYQSIGCAEAVSIDKPNTRDLRNLSIILDYLNQDNKEKLTKEIQNIGVKISGTQDKKPNGKTKIKINEIASSIHTNIFNIICQLIIDVETDRLRLLLQRLSLRDKLLILNKIPAKSLLEYALEIKAEGNFKQIFQLLVEHGADPRYTICIKMDQKIKSQLINKDYDELKKLLKTSLNQITLTNEELELLYMDPGIFVKPSEKLLSTINSESTKQKFMLLSQFNDREFWIFICYVHATATAQKILLGSNNQEFSLSFYRQLPESTQEIFDKFHNCLYAWTQILSGKETLGDALASYDYLADYNSIHLIVKALEYPIGTQNEPTLFYIIYKNDIKLITNLSNFIDGLFNRADERKFIDILFHLFLKPFVNVNKALQSSFDSQTSLVDNHPKMLLHPVTLAAYCGNFAALKLMKKVIDRYLFSTLFRGASLADLDDTAKQAFSTQIKNVFSNFSDKLNGTPLHYAALMANKEIVTWLLDEVKVSAACKIRFAPQFIRVKIGHIQCDISSEKKDISWLLVNSDQLNKTSQESVPTPDAEEDTPYTYDVEQENRPVIFQGYSAFDCARAANIEYELKHPIILAINKTVEKTYEILKQQFINETKETTALSIASEIFVLRPKLVNSIINLKYHKTPYEFLEQNSAGYMHLISDAEIKDTHGDSSWLENIVRLDSQFLRIHLEKNKSLINRANNCGVTLLMFATCLERAETVAILMELGANPQLTSSKTYRKTITFRDQNKVVHIPSGMKATDLSNDEIINALLTQNIEQFLILNKFQEIIEQIVNNKINNAKALNSIMLKLIRQITVNKILKPGLEFCVFHTGDTLLHLLVQIYNSARGQFSGDNYHTALNKTLLEMGFYLTKSIKALFWRHAQFGPLLSESNNENYLGATDFILRLAQETFKKLNPKIITDRETGRLAFFLCNSASNINILDQGKHTPLLVSAIHHKVDLINKVLDKKGSIDQEHLNMQSLENGLTALHFLSCWNDTSPIIEKLVKLGANLSLATTKYFTITFLERSIEDKNVVEESKSSKPIPASFFDKYDANIKKATTDLDNFQTKQINEKQIPYSSQNENIQKTVLKTISQLTGLKYQGIPENGHCLFAAVGLYLGEDQSYLRRIVAAHLEHNLNQFAQFLALPSGKTMKDYLQDLRSGQEWADHIEIEVLMRVLDRPIMIIDSDGNLRNPGDANRFKGEPVFVYYNGRDHYDALLLSKGATGRDILKAITSPSGENEPQQTLTQLSEHSSQNQEMSVDNNLYFSSKIETIREIYYGSLDGKSERVNVDGRLFKVELQVGTTPLILASLLNDDAVVETLLSEMCDNKVAVLHKDEASHTSVYYAYINKFNAVIDKFLNNFYAFNYFFAGLELENTDNNFLETLSTYRFDILRQVFAISQSEIDVIKQMPRSYDLLINSVQTNLIATVTKLRNITVDQNEIKNLLEQSPGAQLTADHLYFMIAHKRYELIPYFLQVRYKELWLTVNKNKISPLYFLCCQVSHAEFDSNFFKDILTFFKNDLKITDKFGRNALWYAILFSNITIVECLLEHGANIGLPEQLAAILYPGENKCILTLIENKYAKSEPQSQSVSTSQMEPATVATLPKPIDKPSSTSQISQWSLSPGVSPATSPQSIQSPFGKKLSEYIQQWVNYSSGHNSSLKQKLINNANAFGYQCDNIDGEGNCFFESVLSSLKNNSLFANYNAQMLRDTIVGYLLKHIDNYKDIFPEKTSKYFKVLQQESKRITFIFVTALSHELNINISIISGDTENPTTVRQNNAVANVYLGFSNQYVQLLPDPNSKKTKDLDSLINQVETDDIPSETVKPGI